MMKAEHLNPFVVATLTTCKTMLGMEVKPGKLQLKTDNTTDADITSVMGLSGKLRGSIVMSFSRETATAMVGKFLGMTEGLSDTEICDGVGELVNIVGGSAKVELNKMGLDMTVSIPNVIVGKGLTVMRNPAYPTFSLPFDSDIGPFTVEVCLMV
jgi:chemotaxis protein CheX